MLDVYLPSWVLQYLLYLSSRIWSCRSPWVLTLVLPKGPGKPRENVASDLLCSVCTRCCFCIKTA